MLADTDTADLMSLGLTRYEAHCYLALIERAVATPAEVARLASVPRQRAYDVLAGLAERGVVISVPGAHARYRACSPKDVTEHLLAERRRQTQALARSARGLAERLAQPFLDGASRAEPLEYVEVLRKPSYAVERIAQLWEAAEQEILAMVSPPYLAPPRHEDATLPTVEEIRALYDPELLEHVEMAHLVRRYAALGEIVRLAANLPMKMTIIDRSISAFNMPDPVSETTSVTTVIVRHRHLAATLRIAFEAVWESAQPLDHAAVKH